jgi:hypothetical protein
MLTNTVINKKDDATYKYAVIDALHTGQSSHMRIQI